MNVDTMRAIDRYAGVPLTFLATLVVRGWEFVRRPARQRPKNVLFIELSEMGSAILADPAMRRVAAWEGAQLHFVIFTKNKPSLQLLGTVPDANIFTIDDGGLVPLALSTLRFLRWCRKKKIDSVIDLELFSRFTALLTGFSGATQRIGFHAFDNEGLYRGHLLTRRVSYNPHQHISKNFVALVETLQLEEDQLPFLKRVIDDSETQLAKVTPTREQVDAVIARIYERCPHYDPARSRVVLVNSNASALLPQRRWSSGSYAQVIQRLLAWDPNILVLLTGSPDEVPDAEEIASLVQDKRCHNFAGGVSFAQLPHLYAASECMITNDSGPAHFAAITEMHTFVIFGPETPALYGSLGPTTPIYARMACSPCVSATNHRKTPCQDNRCLQVITPDQVFGLVQRFLEAKATVAGVTRVPE
ncbi:MAG: glycosyltransferase family 9 protein [Planctomycetes bacterium]|nr:glycosyltransferase family 9 protein [Planctomycetota bacterium]MCB9909766.1 glycosyltransferase family 9 protein [Planctomycetota bacterium]MCB9912325.1 glycosyltransferase family 9 protein [Planctomycetota bacterium]HPF14799.1 glycosyltransferase family 9 protein [Planctomycetota bacterium]HRV80243.1 glycosyltransferase family 9 protein [Planctomycetota bacterium]